MKISKRLFRNSLLLGSALFVLFSIFPWNMGTVAYDVIFCEELEDPIYCHHINGYGRPFVWLELDWVTEGLEVFIGISVEQFLPLNFITDISIFVLFCLLFFYTSKIENT